MQAYALMKNEAEGMTREKRRRKKRKETMRMMTGRTGENGGMERPERKGLLSLSPLPL